MMPGRAAPPPPDATPLALRSVESDSVAIAPVAPLFACSRALQRCAAHGPPSTIRECARRCLRAHRLPMVRRSWNDPMARGRRASIGGDMKRTVMAAVAAATAALATIASVADAQLTRTEIRIVGSSTVYPFTVAVAEQLARAGRFRAPNVEATGTGAGMRSFCVGLGARHADV